MHSRRNFRLRRIKRSNHLLLLKLLEPNGSGSSCKRSSTQFLLSRVSGLNVAFTTARGLDESDLHS
eukprot:1158228-Amphidinium_carterae.1